MKLSRDITIKIHFIFDQLIPPILRDSKLFMYPFFRILFSKKYAKLFMHFRERAPLMSETEFAQVYKIDNDFIDRDTGLNRACIKNILKSVFGKSVLEVGCGRAYLSDKIEKQGYKVTAVDIHVPDKIRSRYPNITFRNGNIEDLPFKDDSFDTVVCTHTLEHVLDFPKSVSELRRVAKNRLIVVVPMQRPYRYTLDPHINFFPYLHSFLQAIKPPKERFVCKVAGGDIFYVEDFKK